MRKLFNNRFLFILASSLIVLIVLGVGAFYLFDDSDDTFVKSGYVLNPLSSKVEKYFFDEDTAYKENLSSMVVFKDVDENDVAILKDSFLHYMDDSLSFLKNGAILDIDSIRGDNAVTFYNITNESIIENEDGEYVIKNTGKDIVLKNFIGRISDNKYIVVGDLSAKLPGNSSNISGDYFEIVYVEEGVINIENKDVKYQVAAEGSYIYVGNVVIDLGDKKITSDDEDVMSITAITINGDENIEIIPRAPEESGNGSGSGNSDETGEGTGNGTGGGGGGSGDGTGTGDGNGTGDGTGEGNIDDEKSDDLIVSLKDASIGSTSVDVIFDIYNQTEEDKFMLKVTNLDTGRTVDMIAEVVADTAIKVNLLSPNTKYLFTVVNERDNGKYFQKIFETVDFGIKLEKSYATDSEIGYKIIVSEGTEITNAKLTLYKYNEETKKNEVVTTSYYDTESGETKYIEKITNISSLEGNIEGEHAVLYDGLESNTIYTAVLDEFSVASSNFKDIYNITLTSMTLKKTPVFSEMTVTNDTAAGSFKLALEGIVDDDSAIVGYTYLIYDKNDPENTVIDPISKTNASPIEVKIGDNENQLKNDTNYFYKVIIEYFDNEKYIEYVTSDSINFVMGSVPYITVVPNDELISYDKIGATIYLTDNSCLISMPGRERCTGTSTTVVTVNKVNSLTGDETPVFTKLVDFDVSENEIKYDLFLDNLQPGTSYRINVRADINNTDKVEDDYLEHTDVSSRVISTKSLSSFINEWVDKGSGATHVINVQSKFISEEGTGTLSPEESAAAIQKVVVKLYEGNNIEELSDNTLLATRSFINDDNFNIKENFYDNGYVITSDETFGLDIDGLKALNDDGKLSEYYTIVIEAYYDKNETNGVMLSNNITAYMISPILLMENIEEPTLELEYITNSASGNIYDKLNNKGTHVGYKLIAAFDREGLLLNKLEPTNINIYVYNNEGKRVKFYVMDSNSKLVLVNKITDSLGESNYYENRIYMDYGTEYHNVDSEIMSRGNGYYIGYEIEVTSSNGNLMYPTNNDENAPSDNGVYQSVLTEKETPTIKMYVASSTKDSITYKYNIDDPDNALYRENTDDNYGFYYTIGSGEASEEKKIDIDLTSEGEFGDITISGLSNGQVYSLYYKMNRTKTGVFETDVVNYLDSSDNGTRIFDGFYDVSLDEYNFKYQIINNALSDNKVIIKILASDDMLKRILSYKVHLVDENKNFLDREITNLSACTSDETLEEVKRCFSIDYIDLKNAGMKSDKDIENVISVSIQAIYDNGLTGYDFMAGSKKNENDETVYDYPYMIMQNNSNSQGLGAYVVYDTDGSLKTWSENIENPKPKGYYTYSLVNNKLFYANKYNTSQSSNITVTLSSIGYTSNYGVLNPKMVSVASMKCDDNTFSFSSITPKIKVSEKTQLINGAVMELTLSGADLADFKNEGTESSPEYYLYVETWNNEEYALNYKNYDYARVRPTLKVKIDAENPNGKAFEAVIDGLMEGINYYFNVYAYMYKGGDEPELVQLFDDNSDDNEYVTKAYNFKSLNYQGVFHSIEVGYSANPEIYGNRDLDTKINLNAYKNMYPYNFDIIYAFCYSDDSSCGIGEKNTNIFKKEILNEDIGDTIKDKEDITQYDLEYGKKVGYYMYVYAVADYYNDSSDSSRLTKRNILLNVFDVGVTLKALAEPTFVVSRNASYVDGNYLIDFNVNVSDPDRTLVGGKYHVMLLDENENIVGTLQELDEEGNYVTIPNYSEYEFDASVVNKSIRITDLSVDTRYTVVVYNDAYLNNYSETIPKEERTYEIKKSHVVYSVNNYGVAFGRELLFSATEHSIVATFLGGSNFDNVLEVNYTIGLWENNQNTSTTTGSYVIGENNKRFEMFKDTSDWRFVIDPAGMTNVLGQTYSVALSFKVRVPDTTDEFVVLTSADNPSFAGRIQYVEDTST